MVDLDVEKLPIESALGLKWNFPKEHLKASDVVLLADEAYTCGQWPLTVAVETELCKDGYVRTVKVRTKFDRSDKSETKTKGGM